MKKYDSLIGNGGEAPRTNAAEVLTKPVHSPSGVQKKIYTASREGASLRMDRWMDGWMEDQMGPSIFFILCGYIDHVHIYLYT